MFQTLLLGAALSMDAFAVTISNCMAHSTAGWRKLIWMPILFGLFQGLMPVAGYFLGSLFADFIETYAGIISFVILAFIGGSMIKEGIEALRGKAEDEAVKELTPAALLIQAVATSIDAFAVGVSLLATGAEIISSSIIIALTTFAFCVIAVAIGRKFGTILGDRALIVGGLVLVGIGIKALIG